MRVLRTADDERIVLAELEDLPAVRPLGHGECHDHPPRPSDSEDTMTDFPSRNPSNRFSL